MDRQKKDKYGEAKENNLYYDKEGDTSSEGSGDDLLNNMEDDYKRIDHLDKYEDEGLDNDEISSMDEKTRKKAEKVLYERDAKNKILTNRLPAAFMNDLESEDEDRKILRNKMKFTEYNEKEEDIAQAEKYIDHQNVKGEQEEWLKQPQTQRYIYKSFEKFIKNFKDEGKPFYEGKIVTMCANNKQSLEICYFHLCEFNSKVAGWLLKYPNLIIPIFNDAAFNLTMEIAPNYSHIHSEIYVRIKELPYTDSLRDLRYHHLNQLIQIKGVITKRSGVFPQMKKMNFYCEKCGEKKGPLYFNGTDDVKIGNCSICSSKGPFKIVVEDTVYRNYQKITIQESPGTVPPGRIPRYKEVIITNDLVDTIRPGDEVEIVGLYIFRYDISSNIKHFFPVFNTFFEANCVKKVNELEVDELTDDDKAEIKKLGQNKNIGNIIFNSIAPSIYGHEFIKKALAVAMFGGVAKDVNEKHKIRGDINVLLLGDPGLAKSQFLKYTQKVFHRSVYTTGKGASAVGLTAGVHKDPVSREWVLEGGALVLADKGICLIDEFDKMNDQDRTSIHEAMEQQSISISKAGIVTSLLARCSVIAAANPIRGRYNERQNFSDNVDLTEPILSRFDILCVVKDQIDEGVDHSLGTFVINSHIKSHPDKTQKLEDLLLSDLTRENEIKKESISQNLLRKYIMYARKYIQPKLSDLNKDKITKFYSELRKESDNIGGIPIAVRHFESIIRISEAHAKIHLRTVIRNDDIDFGIKIMLESFLMSQKFSVSKSMKKKFAHYLTAQEDHIQLLLNILNGVIKEHESYNRILTKNNNFESSIIIKQDTFEREAKELGIYNFDDFYQSKHFQKNNKIENRNIIHSIIN